MSRCTLSIILCAAKTSPRAILDAALEQLERNGAEGLSVRDVPAALGLAPNALYRYDADRDALLTAVAVEGARLLLAAQEDAAHGRAGTDAVRAVAAAYLGFARKRPALYQVSMVEHAFAAEVRPAHAGLWDFAIGLLRNVAGEELAAEAAVALWGLWHGTAGLQPARPLDRRTPGSAIEFGLDGLLEGTAHRSSA